VTIGFAQELRDRYTQRASQIDQGRERRLTLSRLKAREVGLGKTRFAGELFEGESDVRASVSKSFPNWVTAVPRAMT